MKKVLPFFLLLLLPTIAEAGFTKYIDSENGSGDGSTLASGSGINSVIDMYFDSSDPYEGDWSIRADWNPGDYGSPNAPQMYISIPTTVITEGSKLWLFWAFKPDSGFTYASQSSGVVQKGFRVLETRTSDGLDRGWKSFFFVEDSGTTGRLYADLEHVQDDFVNGIPFKNSDKFSAINNGSWNTAELVLTCSDNGSGVVDMTVNGVNKVKTNWYTVNRDDGTTAWTTIVVESYWNGGCPATQSRLFDNIYASTEQSYWVYRGIEEGGGDPTDSTDPVLESTSPANGATGIALTSDIILNISDNVSVDGTTFALTVEGNLETSDVVESGSDTSAVFTLSNADIDASLTYEQVINVDYSVADSSGNEISGSYSFTLLSEPFSGTTFSTGNPGDRDNYTELNSSRWQLNDETGEIVYSINDTSYDPAFGIGLGEYTVFDNQFEEFEIRLKARSDENLGSNSYPDYCIVVGYENSQNYFFNMFNGDTDSNGMFQIRTLESIGREVITTKTASYVTDNDFHDIRIRYQDKAIFVYQDNVFLYSAAVKLPKGKLGFGSYNDMASFDDVEVTDLGSGATFELRGNTLVLKNKELVFT